MFLLTLAPLCRVAADEGMWMLGQLPQIESRMRRAGLKLPLERISNGRGTALSDAVVSIDGGMGTGSMISRDGLMITNHHVAYGDICDLSTLQHNLLEEGFWARSREEELPIRGKTVAFVRKVVDVTAEADSLRDRMQREGHWNAMSMRRLFALLEDRYGRDTDMEVSCASMWNGLKFYMYYYDVFRDVRLVGAPPLRIGSFGGEYDNWGWPQHKGDFALYRVYTAPDGRPADYAPENVPLHPGRYLEISTRGVDEGDFAMVIGFPGRTDRYASSFRIEEREEVKNPIVVENRHLRMDIIRRNMRLDDGVRLKYSDSFFSLSNFADLARWENVCLKRYGVAALRRGQERDLEAWIRAERPADSSANRLLSRLRRGYAARRDAERNLNCLREMWLGTSQALMTANRIGVTLGRLARQKDMLLRASSSDAAQLRASAARLGATFDARTDRELLVCMLTRFAEHVPRSLWGGDMCRMADAFGGDIARMAGDAFDRSVCRDPELLEDFLGRDHTTGQIAADPLVMLARSVRIPRFTGAVNRAERQDGHDLHHYEREYTHLMYAFREAQGIPQYPNANSTMRLTYGRVRGLSPRDGVDYSFRSSIRGYIEKYDPDRREYAVDTTLRRLVADRAWGRWGEDGELYVGFLTDNDITGGNSGSPVLDARGRLVGLAFDGNRESMAGDLYFHPGLARTVCVDIRFVMWCIERYAGAGDLLRELDFR